MLRYHGGKWRLAPWVMSHFPKHRTYCEPFGGAGSILIRKPRSAVEVYNDLDRDLVNVFRVLRDPAAAAELRRLLELTPYARAEFDLAHEPTDDAIERARRVIVLAFMGHGGTGTRRHRTGLRPAIGKRDTMPSHAWAGWPSQIPTFVERLAGVVIEECDAFGLIAKYDAPDVLFYVDPPYPITTRTSLRNGHKQHYRHELTDDDHRRLGAMQHGAEAKVVVSGYSCRLYDEELYADWERHEKRAHADGGVVRTEVVWVKPAGRARNPATRMADFTKRSQLELTEAAS